MNEEKDSIVPGALISLGIMYFFFSAIGDFFRWIFRMDRRTSNGTLMPDFSDLNDHQRKFMKDLWERHS